MVALSVVYMSSFVFLSWSPETLYNNIRIVR